MDVKKLIIWIFKAGVAGVSALAIASCACLFYYAPGIHVTTKTGATDYVWEPGSRSFRATEGFGNIKADENGYFNTYGVNAQDFDILLMGSSHMEAANVAKDENAAYLINEKLKVENILLYNIGISGHDFLRCSKNLPAALKTFSPKKYVIIETASVSFSSEDINKMLSGEMKSTDSYDSGLLYYLQKITYLKLFRSQLEELINIELPQKRNIINKTPEFSGQKINIDNTEKIKAYNNLMKYIGDLGKKENVEVIIFYHPTLKIENGVVSEQTDSEDFKLFSKACEENNISFIDLRQRFKRMYEEDHVLPHGFSNTSLGEGHLNKYGHKAVAEEVSRFIIKETENGK